MIYVVDRIEQDILVLEDDDGKTFSVPKELVRQAKEGDCVEININREETKNRQERIRRLMEELLRD